MFDNHSGYYPTKAQLKNIEKLRTAWTVYYCNLGLSPKKRENKVSMRILKGKFPIHNN